MKKSLFTFVVAMLFSFATFAQNCDTVRNLSASLHSPTWFDVNLSWNLPATAPVSTILTWTNGQQDDGIGTGGAADFDVAHRYTTTDITAYNGRTLQAVSFFPIETACTYSIRVWIGGNISGPGTLVVDQQLSNANLIQNTWNEIVLSSPVTIDASQELWIGFRCNTTTGYPAACDAGPHVPGKGNMMYFQGNWSPLTDLASTLTYNWCIKGIILPEGNGDGTITGYRVERDNVTIGTTNSLNYHDNVAQAGIYTYDVYALWDNGCTETSNTIVITMEDDPCGIPISTFPYICSFDNPVQNLCWNIYNLNDDGSTFHIDTVGGNVYYPYSSLNSADDWLESPAFLLNGNQYFSFDYKARSSSYPEKFSVLLASAVDTFTIMPSTTINNTSYMTKLIDLQAYSGEYRVIFVAESDADMYYLYFDNFIIENIPDPQIVVNIDTIDFNLWAVGQLSISQPVIVTGLSLTNDITVSTTLPFELSLDNINFSTTVTIPTILGDFFFYDTLYVRYHPTVAGQHEELALFTNPEATSVNIVLLGESIDCDVVTNFPYVCPFDPYTPTTICWSVYDVNNDGDQGDGMFSFMPYDANNIGCAVYFASNDTSVQTPNDWLVSPSFAISAPMYASFKYLVSEDIDWDLWDYVPVPETFSVWIIPDGDSYADVTTPIIPSQTVSNVDFVTQYIDLTPYINQTIQIAIKIETPTNVGGYFVVDDFTVDSLPTPAITVIPDTIYLSAPASLNSTVKRVNIEGWTLTEDLTATTHAPFSISTNGITFDTIVTLPYTPVNTNVDLYVRFNSQAVGTFNDIITIISSGATGIAYLIGTAIECSPLTLPFDEGFEAGIPDCWLTIDADGDGFGWDTNSVFAAHTGNGIVASASYINNYGALHPENWLITPQLIIPATGANLTWWVAAQDNNYAREYYEVKVTTSGIEPSDFNTVFSETLNTSTWKQKYVSLASYANQTIRLAFVHKNTTDEFWIKIDDINVSEGVGIDENKTDFVSIYPNPTNNILNVQAENYKKVEILNFLGQIVYTNEIDNSFFQISVANLTSGVYFIRLTGENVVTKKFVKQ